MIYILIWAKFSLVLLFVTALTAEQEENASCEQFYAIPENCFPFLSQRDCYRALIKVVKRAEYNYANVIEMGICYKSTHYPTQRAWFGIGFNKQPTMRSAEAYIVTIPDSQNEPGQILSIENWHVGNYSAGNRDSDQNDYFAWQWGWATAENETCLTFERLCDTGDSQDLNLCKGDFYWIFPYSGGPVGSGGTLQQHAVTPDIVKALPLEDCTFIGYPDEKCYRLYKFPPNCDQYSWNCYVAEVNMFRNGDPYKDIVEIKISYKNGTTMNPYTWFGVAINKEPYMYAADAVLATVSTAYWGLNIVNRRFWLEVRSLEPFYSRRLDNHSAGLEDWTENYKIIAGENYKIISR